MKRLFALFVGVLAYLNAPANAQVADLSECSPRNFICVSERLLEDMVEVVGPRQKRKIRQIQRQLISTCGQRTWDVRCAGQALQQGMAVVLGDGTRPRIYLGRSRPQKPVDLFCKTVPGYRGKFIARVEDGFHFGSGSFSNTPYNQSCQYALRNANRRAGVACTSIVIGRSTRLVPTNMTDAFQYGEPFVRPSNCIETVREIRRDRLCSKLRGSPARFRIMTLRSRTYEGRAFTSLDRCLRALSRR